MSPVGNFGGLIVETDIDAAVVDVLSTWLPMYLAQVEREYELENHTLARPVSGSYDTVLEDDSFPNPRLPAILVTTASTDEVMVDGDGRYHGTWNCTVSSVVRGRTAQEARGYAALYGGSVRRALTHQYHAMGGDAKFTRGRLAQVADTTAQNRELAVSISSFSIFSSELLYAGAEAPRIPSDPYDDPDPVGNPDQPYDPLDRVGKVTADVTGVPISETPGG